MLTSGKLSTQVANTSRISPRSVFDHPSADIVIADDCIQTFDHLQLYCSNGIEAFELNSLQLFSRGMQH